MIISELNTKYKAILQLEEELTKLGIEHELKRLFDGYILYYPSMENRIGDVIEHSGSYGHSKDLMEAYGFPECGKDRIISCLTVEEALTLFKNAAGV